MDAIIKTLQGKKVYILCAIAVLIGGAELIGIDVLPDVDQTNALSWIWSGAVGAAIRGAIAKV